MGFTPNRPRNFLQFPSAFPPKTRPDGFNPLKKGTVPFSEGVGVGVESLG